MARQLLGPSRVDQALEQHLVLATSARHNDMVLCCGSAAPGPPLKLEPLSPLSPEEATPKAQKALEKESHRLRIENADA